MSNTRTPGWDERDYKLWSALGVLPSYGRLNRTDHLVSLAQVEALLRKHAEERFDAKRKKETCQAVESHRQEMQNLRT